MKQQNLAKNIMAAALIIGLAFGIYTQVKAQQNVVGYLESRLKKQKVPFAGIKVTQDFPLQIEVTLKSGSNGKKGVPEDPIILQLLEREIILSQQEGYFIDKYTRITLSEQGKQIAKSNKRVKILDHIFLDMSPSQVSDDATLGAVERAISPGGLSVTHMGISSEDGLQFLKLQMEGRSIQEVNASLPGFIGSLRPSLESVNADGSHIVVCQVELKDVNGNMLLNYILDLQLHSERWWMEENVTTTWFSEPAPAP